MSVKECIEKLVISGQVARKTADDALALYDRMNNRYSAQAGPAAAEAAAALATARALRQGAAEKAARIANDVRAFTDAEARVLEHPYGRKAGLMALMTKDMWRGGGLMRDAPIENRIARGIAFMTLSTAAGAVSLQAAAIAAGKDPLDMGSAKFWTQAYIKGGEIIWVQPLDFITRGLGITSNYTHVTSKSFSQGTALGVLPGIPSYTYNVGGYYENHNISLHITYVYNAKLVAAAAPQNAVNLPLIADARGELDFSTDYTLPKFYGVEMQVTFDGVNVTNAPLRTVFGFENAPFSVYFPGASYMLGLRAKF